MATSASPGTSSKPINTAVSGQGLTAGEQQQIEHLGRHMDGTQWSLTELMTARDRHAQLLQEAVRAVGAQSGAAQLNRAAIARLDQLIQEKQSPHDVAREKLGKVLHRAKHEPRAVSDKHLNAAVGEVVRAKKPHAGAAGHHAAEHTMHLLVEAARVRCQRKRAELEKLTSEARHPGSHVTDMQLRHGIAALFAAERHRAQLGDENAELPGRGIGDLVAEAVRVVHTRRLAALRDSIDEAKRPGSAITDKQLAGRVRGVLETARTEQLLGAEDAEKDGTETFPLIYQAMEVAQYRHQVELRRLLTSARQHGSAVTPRQISNVVKKLLADERGKQLLGEPPDTPEEADLWKLMEDASGVYDELRKADPKPHLRHPHLPKQHVLYVVPPR
jgi:hypothetical protein